ncbi:MFS transporter [Streptomyces sp. NPDC005805]|uniref:MFS transporter n=1 Tax=Streptomyces sp. NPDC005805 TaxID=3157068 RepID=UPI0033F8020A
MPDSVNGEARAPGGDTGRAGFPLLTVLALMAGIFAVGSEELVVSPLLLDMARSFDTSVAVMALSVSVYGVSTAIGALLFAPLGDRVSRRVCLISGMAVFLVGTLLCAFAAGPGVFFTGRALAGLATGAFVPTAYAFVGDRIPYAYRAKAMGIIVSSWSLSLVLGVPLGSFIGEWAGWRWAFGLLAVLGLLVICVLSRVSGEPAAGPEQRAEENTPAQGWRRSTAEALRAPRVGLYVLVTFLNMLGFYGMYTYLGSAMQYRFGAEGGLTGVMILVYGLGFATSFVTGKWADGRGKERVLAGLLAGLVPALALIPFVSRWTPLLVVCLFLWGAMQSLVVTLLSTLLSECSTRHRGTVLAFYSLATNLAVALGAAVMGPLFTAYGFSAVGYVCAGIMLVGCALSAVAHRRGGDRDPAPAVSPGSKAVATHES